MNLPAVFLFKEINLLFTESMRMIARATYKLDLSATLQLINILRYAPFVSLVFNCSNYVTPNFDTYLFLYCSFSSTD